MRGKTPCGSSLPQFTGIFEARNKKLTVIDSSNHKRRTIVFATNCDYGHQLSPHIWILSGWKAAWEFPLHHWVRLKSTSKCFLVLTFLRNLRYESCWRHRPPGFLKYWGFKCEHHLYTYVFMGVLQVRSVRIWDGQEKHCDFWSFKRKLH